jgi:hypothetical protein
MSRLNWNRLGFFVLGTFFGQMLLGMFGGLLGRKG